MKTLNTINVVELFRNNILNIRSFHDNLRGNKQAKKLFTECLKENIPIISQEDIDDYLENKNYDDENGYHLFLFHSVG